LPFIKNKTTFALDCYRSTTGCEPPGEILNRNS